MAWVTGVIEVDRHRAGVKNYAVSRTPNPSTDAVGAQGGSSAPDWDHVPFDVGCARCGHDLRGQSEPICPHCELTFDWADAAPIERLTCVHCDYHLYGLRQTRCPECGNEFTWEEALAEYHRKRTALFEYQWRRHPFRSLVSTWFGVLRPSRFWRSIDIHDPPRVGPLLVHGLAAFLALTILVPLENAMFLWMGGLYISLRDGHPLIRVLQDLPSSLYESFTRPGLYFWPLAHVVWFILTLAAMAIFRASIRNANVSFVHVLRVVIYSQVLLAPVAVITFLCMAQIYNAVTILLNWWPLGDSVQPIWNACYGGLVVLTVWSQRAGFRYYALMRNSFLIPIVVQAVALLAAQALFLVLVLLRADG